MALSIRRQRSMYIAPGQAEGAGAHDGFQQVGVCIVPLALASLDDAEGEMRDPSAVDHPRALQVDGSGPQMVEQRDAAP